MPGPVGRCPAGKGEQTAFGAGALQHPRGERVVRSKAVKGGRSARSWTALTERGRRINPRAPSDLSGARRAADRASSSFAVTKLTPAIVLEHRDRTSQRGVSVTNNELVLLDQILDQRQKERDAPLPNDRAFELFACEQALRDFEVSTDDILNGLVGGGGDGAIDGVYVFLGDSLLEEDDEVFGEDFAPTKVGQGARLSLWLVQAKREESFTGTALDLVASSTSRLLDLGKSDEDLLA